jgi:hypothetical protein
VSILFRRSASVSWLDDEDDEDDDFDDDDFDDDELELFEEDDGLVDALLAVAATLSFLSSPPRRRNAAMATAATASTATMIHFALFDPAPGPPGGGPTGTPGDGGGTGGSGGIAAVGGGMDSIGCVAPAWKSGCCSGGYHFPSDACHQPSP